MSLALSGCFSNGSMTFQSLSSSSSSSGSSLQWGTPLTAPYTFTVGQIMTPALQVYVKDSSGKTSTQSSATITLKAYTDTACTVSTNDANSTQTSGSSSGTTNDTVETATAVQGVATFSTLSSKHSGTYYLLASSSDGLLSTCSPAITILPGSADHLATGTGSPYKTTVGSSISISVQVVDAYENPTAPASPFQILFSTLIDTSSTGTNGTFTISSNTSSTASVTTDSTGAATVQYNLPASISDDYTVIQATAPATAGLATSSQVGIPVFVKAGALHHFSMIQHPPIESKTHSHWTKLRAEDSSGHLVDDYTGNIKLNVKVTSVFPTPTPIVGASGVTFGAADSGEIYSRYSVPYPIPSYSMSAAVYSAVDTSNATYSINPGFLVNTSPICELLSPSIDWVGGVSANDFQTGTNWTGGAVPGSSDLFTIANNHNSCTLSSAVLVGCGHIISGLFNLQSTLAITGDQFAIDSTATVTDQIATASTSSISFQGNYTGGIYDSSSHLSSIPQYFTINAPTQTFNQLNVTGYSYRQSLFMEGSGTTYFPLGLFNSYVNSSGINSATVYVSSSIVVTPELVIQPGMDVIVTPGGSLTALGGIKIVKSTQPSTVTDGSLTIQGGGQVILGANQVLKVYGVLALNGTASNPAVIQGYASSGTYSVSINSGGILDASRFQISGLNSQGFLISSGSTVKAFDYGSFTNFSQKYPPLIIGSSGGVIHFVQSATQINRAYFLEPQFNSTNGTAYNSNESSLVIDASQLDQPLAIVTKNTTKTVQDNASRNLRARSIDPNKMLIFTQ